MNYLPIAVAPGASAASDETRVFAEADLTAYARTRLAPSYMPFPIARETARQMTRETKSATYPKIKITKAAITCSARLSGAKAIGHLLRQLLLSLN
jgi:hypothetical protein